MGTVGRPPKFNDVGELNKLIDHYFNTITITYPLFDTVVDEYDEQGKATKIHEEPRLNNAGEQVYRTEYIERPSILAMCRHIGTNRETLLDYEAKKEFSDTIKTAKARIEEYVEQQLYRKDQVTGIIFNLKNNFGWKDKTEVDTNNTTLNLNKDITALSDEELEEELEKLK